MLKTTSFLAAGAVFAAIGATAAAQDASTVVATVGDTEITLGEMIITRAQLPPQYAQFPPDVLFDGILDQLIQQQLLADALENTPDRVELTLRNERRSLMAGEVITEITEEAVTEEAIRAAYDARYADAPTGVEYNASHLLVETEIEAAAARARILDGAEFADVAREISTGPTGPNGGNLGWFGDGQMVPEFEEAVKSLEIGGLSEPVQTQFGWHIVTLNDTREAEAPGLEDLRQELTAEVRDAAITARIEDLRGAATITMPEDGAFDPNLLQNLELLEP